ncbi:MAG: hypothetical protein QOJ08_56, partial [Ilumatobacteraceae bacterium]
MAEHSINQDARHRLVDAYVAAVAIVAVILTGVVFFLAKDGIIPPSNGVYVAIFCGLLFIGETRTKWFRFGDGGQVTPGWAFAFSIVLLGAPLIAIAAMAACTLFVDVRDRKSIAKIVFNAGQISASLASGEIVLQLLGLGTAITQAGHLSVRWGIGIVVSGALVFT